MPELRTTPPLAVDAPARRDPVVLTAALTSMPPQVLARLRASNEEIARARALAAGPAAPASDDPRDVRRWMATVEDAADDLLHLAELLAGSPPSWAAVVAGIRARGEATRRGQLAITGADLLALGIPAGPELGRLLSRLLEAVLEDPARNTREGLLALAGTAR